MSKTRYLGAGAALALVTLVYAAPASAQVTPIEEYRGLPGAVLLRGDPREPGYQPREATPGQEQERFSVPAEEWVKHPEWGGIATYQRIANRNKSFCSITDNVVVRVEGLMTNFMKHSEKFRGHEQRYIDLGNRVDKLKGVRVGGSWARRLGGVLAIGGAAAISGPYALVVAPSILGNEAAATGNDRAQDVSRDVMRANVDLTLDNIALTRDNIESNLLTLEMDLFWVELVHPWCTDFYPKTQGGVSSASYTSSHSSTGPSTRVETRKTW